MKTSNIKAKGLFVKAALLFSTLLLVPTLVTTDSHANMINKFKTGFYFEKYETPEEAKAELLKLHPIGSDVEGLVGTLEGAGAKSYKPIISEKYKNNPELHNMLWYKYSHRTIGSIFPREWDLIINFSKNKEIKNFSIGYYQGE